MPKLNETYVKRLPYAPPGKSRVWDSEVKGLCVYIGKRSKTWYFQRDLSGRTIRKLIGRYPTISADAARQAALAMALDMTRGAGRIFELSAPTLSEAMAIYLRRPKLRSDEHKENIRQMFQNHLSDWMRLRLDEIDRRMVVARHAKLVDRPSLANHLFRAFRTIWNNAKRTSNLPETPTIAIEWHEEKVDNPIIADLLAWQRQVDAFENPIHGAYYRLLLFTGFRKSEALALRWQDVHQDRIHLPMTKNGRSFDFPISEIHLDILEPMKGLHREWVVPSPKAATGHLMKPSPIDWSPHAHRRTFATVAVEAGVLEEVVGRLLNHTPQTVTGARYVKTSWEALRPAMEATTQALAGSIGKNRC